MGDEDEWGKDEFTLKVSFLGYTSDGSVWVFVLYTLVLVMANSIQVGLTIYSDRLQTNIATEDTSAPRPRFRTKVAAVLTLADFCDYIITYAVSRLNLIALAIVLFSEFFLAGFIFNTWSAPPGAGSAPDSEASHLLVNVLQASGNENARGDAPLMFANMRRATRRAAQALGVASRVIRL